MHSATCKQHIAHEGGEYIIKEKLRKPRAIIINKTY